MIEANQMKLIIEESLLIINMKWIIYMIRLIIIIKKYLKNLFIFIKKDIQAKEKN